MRFSLTIESNNAAMVDDTVGELVILLDRTARDLRDDRTSGTLLDVNGNSVGTWDLTTD